MKSEFIYFTFIRYLLLAISYLLFAICYLPHIPVFADTSTNDNLNIQIDNLNINSDIPTVTQPVKKPSADQSLISKANLLSEASPFSFSISNSLIDFGIITPTNSIYRTTNLELSNLKKGYIVTAFEDHPLTISGSDTILPDTTCDNGSCSDITSALWQDTLTYGFGYRCDNVSGNNCPVDFNLDNYYRQFSDASNNKTPQIIMSSESPQSNAETQITYKINTSKSQTNGSYVNTITYLASPGY